MAFQVLENRNCISHEIDDFQISIELRTLNRGRHSYSPVYKASATEADPEGGRPSARHFICILIGETFV